MAQKAAKKPKKCPTCRQQWSKNLWNPFCETCKEMVRSNIAAKNAKATEQGGR